MESERSSFGARRVPQHDGSRPSQVPSGHVRHITESLLEWLEEQGVLRDPVDRLVSAATPAFRKLRASGEAGTLLLQQNPGARQSWCDTVRSELDAAQRQLLVAWLGMRGGDQDSWTRDRSVKRRGRPAPTIALKAYIDEWWLPSLSDAELTKTSLARAAFPDGQRIGVKSADLPLLFAFGCLLVHSSGTGSQKPEYVILPRVLALILVEAAWTAAVAEGLIDPGPRAAEPKRSAVTSDWNWRDLELGPVHEQQRTQGVGWWHGGN